MPSIDQHPSADAVKLLLVGNSGSGKTTALATLANAGYELFILDFDNGLDTLRGFVKPEHHARVHYKTFIDEMVGVQGAMRVPPSAAMKALQQLDNWVEPAPAGAAPADPAAAPALVAAAPSPFGPRPAQISASAAPPAPSGTISLGGPKSWGPGQVLVIDSLTFFGNACMNFALAMNGRTGQRPTQQDWGDAIRLQENLLTILYADSIRCQVIVTAHLAFQDEAGGTGLQRAYPSALGSKLPPKVSRYFNSVLQTESVPGLPGQPPRFRIHTQSTARLDLKSPVPSMPAVLDCDPMAPPPSGLAKFIELVRGRPLGA